MSLSIALRAGVVYTCALLLARTGPPAGRRVALITASVLVLALPLLSFGPRWPAPRHTPEAVLAAVGALQEPALGGLSAAAPSAAGPVALSSVLFAVWAIGCAVAVARLVADLLAAGRLRSSAVDRRGDVAYSAAIDVPVAIGLLRPLVLLPLAAESWTQERLHLVLAHERAHTGGRDNLWLLVARIAACLHWFDPLAWRTAAELRDACEHRADDVTLAGGVDPAEYAHTLVALARRAPAAAVAMARPSRLEGRVRAVLGERRPPGRLGSGLRAVAVAGLALVAATAPASAPGIVPPGLSAALEREADLLMATHQPEGVVVLVLDARTGVVLARAVRGGVGERRMAPGSVLKPFVVAAALEAGIPESAQLADGDMASILERSSNAGAVDIAAHVGRPAVAEMFVRVGLPAPASLGLDELTLGAAPVTPLEVATAWTHLAGHGAVPGPIAARTRELLVGAVEGEHATGSRAAVPGVRVAGKTGTAPLVGPDGAVQADRTLASFVGLVPADDPDLVVLVAVAGPRGDAWGGVVAAPSFRRIVEGFGPF